MNEQVHEPLVIKATRYDSFDRNFIFDFALKFYFLIIKRTCMQPHNHVTFVRSTSTKAVAAGGEIFRRVSGFMGYIVKEWRLGTKHTSKYYSSFCQIPMMNSQVTITFDYLIAPLVRFSMWIRSWRCADRSPRLYKMSFDQF